MAKGKKKSEVVITDAVNTGTEVSPGAVVAWKATRPMTTLEHDSLSKKLRTEAAATGLNIVLVPFSVNQEGE